MLVWRMLRVTSSLTLTVLLIIYAAIWLGGQIDFVDMIAYTRWVNSQTEIFIGDTAGRAINLTKNRVLDTSPAWHPDGTQLAFNSSRTGTTEIFIMDMYGENIKQLTDTSTNNLHPRWSPDGTQIAYMLERESLTSRYDIFTIAIASGQMRNLTDTQPSETTPQWSPDGTKLSYYHGTVSRLAIVDLPFGEFFMQTPPATQNLGWSADGSQIAYVGSRDVFVSGLIDTIYVQDVSPESRPLMFPMDMESVSFPTWHPDGSQIVFLGEVNSLPLRRPSRRIIENQIFMLDVTSGELSQITNIPGMIRTLEWSADGTRLMFTVLLPQEPARLCFLRIKNNHMWCPPAFYNAMEPVWRPPTG